MSKVIREIKKKTINESGEITTTEKEQIIQYPKTADFVMSFTKDIGYLQHLSKGEIITLFMLLKIVNNNNEIILNSAIKRRIANELNMKIRTVTQNISALNKKRVISREDNGIYRINPWLFGKGNWNNIKKLRMNFEWDFNKQTKKITIDTEYLDPDELEQINKELINKQREEWDISHQNNIQEPE